MVAGVGFFTDAYDIFAINIASTMLGYVYGHSKPLISLLPSTSSSSPPSEQALSTNQDLGVKVATPLGIFIGQFLFGWLADVLGRKRMCKSPFLPMVTGTHAYTQTVSHP